MSEISKLPRVNPQRLTDGIRRESSAMKQADSLPLNR